MYSNDGFIVLSARAHTINIYNVNIMSYNSAFTIRSTTVAVVNSLCSPSVCEPARETGDNESGQYGI